MINQKRNRINNMKIHTNSHSKELRIYIFAGEDALKGKTRNSFQVLGDSTGKQRSLPQ